MAKTIKPVAFNDVNPHEKDMLKHVSRKNFSGYVKKLILADMKKAQPEALDDATECAEDEVVISTSAADRLEKLKKQSKSYKQPKPPMVNLPGGSRTNQ